VILKRISLPASSGLSAFPGPIEPKTCATLVLDRLQVSAENLAQVVSKAIQHGGTMKLIPDRLALLALGVIPSRPGSPLVP
jgi:hypothetical protein